MTDTGLELGPKSLDASVGEFVKDVDSEFSLERVTRNVAFFQLQDDFANQRLVLRRL